MSRDIKISGWKIQSSAQLRCHIVQQWFPKSNTVHIHQENFPKDKEMQQRLYFLPFPISGFNQVDFAFENKT